MLLSYSRPRSDAQYLEPSNTNNIYVPLPPTGMVLDKGDRARLLKNTKVQFSDIESKAEVESLAIDTVDADGGAEIEEVKKRR